MVKLKNYFFSVHKGKEGVIDLELGWATGLTSTTSILVYMAYDQLTTFPGRGEPFINVTI